MRIQTPVLPLFTGMSNSFESFIPATDPLDSTRVRDVVAGILLLKTANGALKARPAFQYGDDGIVWNETYTLGLGTGSDWATTTTAWVWRDGAVDLETIATAAPRLFVRFGFVALNTGTDGTLQSGMARLTVDVRPMNGGSVSHGPTKINTLGSTTWVFTPLGGPVDSGRITQLRRSLRIEATSGDLEAGAAFQISTDGGLSWHDNAGGSAGTFTAFPSTGGTVTGDTSPVDYARAFESFTIDAALVRFGVRARNISGSDVNAALASLRVDWR